MAVRRRVVATAAIRSKENWGLGALPSSLIGRVCFSCLLWSFGLLRSAVGSRRVLVREEVVEPLCFAVWRVGF